MIGKTISPVTPAETSYNDQLGSVEYLGKDTRMQADQNAAAPIGALFEKNRWWSNPDLSDIDTMIALILSDPTPVDLALAASLWGPERIRTIRSEIEQELTPVHRQVLDRFYEKVLLGVKRASQRTS